VQLLDDQGKILATYNLWDHAKGVNALADLPGAWTDSSLPWAGSVQRVYNYLAADQEIRSAGPMHVLFLEVKSPQTPFATLRIRAVPNPEIFQAANLRDYTVLVGVMEACRLDDEWRYEYDYQKQVSEQKEVYDYLNEGERGSLLLPNREYRVGVRYQAYRFEDDSTSSEEVRYFHFKTDNALPARLDPFILATYPRQGESFVFYEDPIQVIFNDSTTLQMYDVYGAKIKFSVHPANGPKFVPLGLDPGQLQQLEAQYPAEGPYQVLYFDLTDGELEVEQPSDIGIPYYDTLQDLVEKQFKCINGEGLTWKYDKLTIKGNLKPLMAYTLQLFPAPKVAGEQISVKPVTTSASDIKNDGTSPKEITNAGKFLRRFTTSRYRNMQEFARDIYGEYVQHRPLEQPIDVSALDPNAVAVHVDDAAFNDALREAGEDDLTPPRKNRVVLYWAPIQGAFKPHALLIDAVEPLWRDTEIPLYETVDDSSNDDFVYDPNFKRVVMTKLTDLLVSEEDGVVSKLIYGFGGMRILALIKPDQLPQDDYDPPTTLTLVLKRGGIDIFNLNPETEKLDELALTPHAPWEDEHDYA
jgi:hypothetical protein